jgi:uncharacterized protein (TIGR02996 family)
LRVFLDDVRTSPDDNTLRRILADWLEDQETPEDVARAELIRLQCLQAESPRRLPEVMRREEELISEWFWNWLGPLADFSSPWQFDRGRVRLTLSANLFQTPHFADLWQSEAFAWVDSATLTHATPGNIGHLASHSYLAGLRELVVQDGRVGNNGLAVLAASPHLHDLRILRLPMAGIGGRATGPLRMPKLETLDLSQNCLRDTDLANLLEAGLPAVRHLYLGYNNLSDGAIALLALSPSGSLLQTLDLVGNRRLGDTGIGWLATLPLRRLDLSQSIPTGAGLHAVGTMKELEELGLNRCELGDDRFKEMIFAGGLSRLHTLRAGRALLGDESLIALMTAAPRPWRSLQLPHNHIGRRGVEALAESPDVMQLRELNLANNRVDDQAAFALARSPHLGRLRHLDLSENPLTPQGIEALVRRFGRSVLTR